MRLADPILSSALGVLEVPPGRAIVAALVVSASLALVVRRVIAVGVCVALLVATVLGLRVDAAPPSPSTRTVHAR
jgi:hypothetical protein